MSMSSPRALAIAFALTLIAWLRTAPAAPSEPLSPSCVPKPVQAELLQCPEGLKRRVAKAERKPVFTSTPPTRRRKAEQRPDTPGDPDLELVAQFRSKRLPKKVETRLLVSTIQRLEGLLERTPEKSPDRVDIMRRTAEEYVNLRKTARDQRLHAEAALRVARKHGDAAGAAQARRTIARMKRLEAGARQGAIKHYARLRRAYPKYPKIDEVLYYLAFELEQGNEQEKARKIYFELIQKAPNSRYVPNAYLAFGELFFVEAQADPSKWDLAAKAYAEVIKYPAPRNKVLGYARYKLAYVYWNQEDYQHAISEMKRVIEFGSQHHTLPGARQLVGAARRDLVPLYAASGRPERAYAFFKPLSGDRDANDAKTLQMLRELALTYLDTGHYREGVAVFEELLRRDRGERWCEYQTHITEATEAIHSGDKPRIVAALGRQLAALAEFEDLSHEGKHKLQCKNDTLALIAETAMSWHLEAVGSGGVRGTGDPQTMQLAAQLYDRVIERFEDEDFSQFTFPRIVKTDWPSPYKLKYARADLCYFAQDWECAAEAFTKAVEEDPNAPDAPEAAYAAALAFQHIFNRERANGAAHAGMEDLTGSSWERLQPRELSRTEENMIDAFDRYLCVMAPDESAEIAEQYADIEYARARLYFEARHWEQAATAFRKIALERPRHDSAIYAAQLALESLNVLREHAIPKRDACVEDIGRDVAVFSASFCDDPTDDVTGDQCAIFTRISCDVDRLRAEQLVARADSSKTRRATDLYEEAGDIYLSIWRKYGEQQLANGHPAACENLDEVLSNLARSYQAAHLLAKAIQARRILVDPRYGLQETKLAKQAWYDLGQNHQAIAMYAEAASYFERYAAATNYHGEHSAEALSDAVVLRLGLGQDEPALANARAYARHLGSRHPERASRIAFAIAAHHGERGEWREARQHLQRAIRSIDASAELDIKTQAHALLARSYLELGQRQQAAQQYAAVRRLWSDERRAANSILRAKGSQTERQRRLGRALTALGEATFFVAEQKRRAVERIRFPEYRGPGTISAVDRHLKTKVKDWISRKKPLLEEATRSYTEVLEIEPDAPPAWVIAAGATVGTLWSQFVAEFRAAPIPDSIRRDEQLRNAYYEALDRASEPYQQLARQAYEKCLEYSVKYQYFDDHSRACEVWLAENYRADYHLLDEFRGSPNRANSAAREHPPALRIGGQPLRAGR
jgi:tetratricopeptide (TPR) repeat protein